MVRYQVTPILSFLINNMTHNQKCIVGTLVIIFVTPTMTSLKTDLSLELGITSAPKAERFSASSLSQFFFYPSTRLDDLGTHTPLTNLTNLRTEILNFINYKKQSNHSLNLNLKSSFLGSWWYCGGLS